MLGVYFILPHPVYVTQQTTVVQRQIITLSDALKLVIYKTFRGLLLFLNKISAHFQRYNLIIQRFDSIFLFSFSGVESGVKLGAKHTLRLQRPNSARYIMWEWNERVFSYRTA